MHQNLDTIYKNAHLLDEKDKEVILKIELYVENLVKRMSPEQIQQIVKMDMLLYSISCSEKQKANLLSRNEIIEELLYDAVCFDENEDSEYLELEEDLKNMCNVRPFEKLDMFDKDHYLIDILGLDNEFYLDELIIKLNELLAKNKTEITSIDEKYSRLTATRVINESNQKYTLIEEYFTYKNVTKYNFEIDNGGKLLKISRSESGPKFSVIYFNDYMENGIQITGQQHKMVLYRGKDNRALGYGKFGKVKLLQNYSENNWYAIKIMSINDKMYNNEIEGLKKVNKFYSSITISSRDKNYIVMELAPGVRGTDFVSESVKKHGKCSEIIDFLLSAANEIQHLHNRQMIHRDIKLDNFVYDEEEHMSRLIDFQFLVTLDNNNEYPTKSYMGTEWYMAPEIITAKQSNSIINYSKSTDIYAFGKILKAVEKRFDIENRNNHENETETETEIFIKRYSSLFMNEFQYRPSDLYAFIDEAKLLLVKLKSSEEIKQPLLFSNKPAQDRANSPIKKKEKTQDSVNHSAKARLGMDL